VTAEVLVLDTVRTPVGRHGGALAGTRPDDLAAHVLRELLARQPGLAPRPSVTWS
jgi:acetyl-CoA acetyltransferase